MSFPFKCITYLRLLSRSFPPASEKPLRNVQHSFPSLKISLYHCFGCWLRLLNRGQCARLLNVKLQTASISVLYLCLGRRWRPRKKGVTKRTPVSQEFLWGADLHSTCQRKSIRIQISRVAEGGLRKYLILPLVEICQNWHKRLAKLNWTKLTQKVTRRQKGAFWDGLIESRGAQLFGEQLQCRCMFVSRVGYYFQIRQLLHRVSWLIKYDWSRHQMSNWLNAREHPQ